MQFKKKQIKVLHQVVVVKNQVVVIVIAIHQDHVKKEEKVDQMKKSKKNDVFEI